MNFEIKKAERKKAKLRIGITSPSGGGKTYSSLLLAKGLVGKWDKIVMIDTENGSGEMYSQLGGYNVLTLTEPFSPEHYVEAIHAAESAGMEAIIIDSVTHEWDGKGGCLEIVEQLGGRFTDWNKVTPRHRKFLEAILQSPCHIITTTRRKQDYAMTQDSKGKMKVEKMGLKEVQREGFEYELTLNLEIDIRHNATASKDRTGLFMEKPPFVISEKTGEELKEWSESGKESEEDKKKKGRIKDIKKILKELKSKEDFVEKQLGKPMTALTLQQLDKVFMDLQDIKHDRATKKTEKEEGDVPTILCELCGKKLNSAEVDEADNSKAKLMIKGKQRKYICKKCKLKK